MTDRAQAQVDAIEARIVMAVDTVRAIPESDLGIEGGEDWPEYVLTSWDEFKAGQTARRIPPTDEAMADLLIVIGWLHALDYRVGELVWLKAAGHPWRVVSNRTGCVRPKAWSRWKTALAKIARKAKARSKATTATAKIATPPTAKATIPDPDPKEDEPALPLIAGVDATPAQAKVEAVS